MENSEQEITSINQIKIIQNDQVQSYGNLIILFSYQNYSISLGPHYYCFIPALIGFIAAAILLTLFINQKFTNQLFRIINILFSSLWILSYIIVAFSNPGVVLPQKNVTTNEQISNKTLEKCSKCGAIKQKRTFHCKHCNVCIQDYDHHCPWVSKCIGIGNYEYFNFFVGITPLYIMYFIIVLCVCIGKTG